jgi:hypothetical protein
MKDFRIKGIFNFSQLNKCPEFFCFVITAVLRDDLQRRSHRGMGVRPPPPSNTFLQGQFFNSFKTEEKLSG